MHRFEQIGSVRLENSPLIDCMHYNIVKLIETCIISKDIPNVNFSSIEMKFPWYKKIGEDAPSGLNHN